MDGLAVYIAETYECSEPLGDPEKSLAVAVLGTLYFGGFFYLRLQDLERAKRFHSSMRYIVPKVMS